MCKRCWDNFWEKVLDFNKSSSEYLLNRYVHIVAFNTTSSRWGFASVFSTAFLSFIAISIGLLAITIALSQGFDKMTAGAWVALGFAIFIGLFGMLGMSFVGWLAWYFLRFPLKRDIPVLENIDKAVSEDIPHELQNINTSIQEIVRKMEQQNRTKGNRQGKHKK